MIAHETEIVATAYDAARQAHSYTVERGGNRWTVEIPDAHLAAHTGPNAKQLRRNHVAKVLEAAMRGAPDAAR
jgi:hypothetical protein